MQLNGFNTASAASEPLKCQAVRGLNFNAEIWMSNFRSPSHYKGVTQNKGVTQTLTSNNDENESDKDRNFY